MGHAPPSSPIALNLMTVNCAPRPSSGGPSRVLDDDDEEESELSDDLQMITSFKFDDSLTDTEDAPSPRFLPARKRLFVPITEPIEKKYCTLK
jgi:hypothetical protein